MIKRYFGNNIANSFQNNTDPLSQFSAIEAALPYIMAELPLAIRLQLSYELNDVLLHCSFDGKTCTEYKNSIFNELCRVLLFCFNVQKGFRNLE